MFNKCLLDQQELMLGKIYISQAVAVIILFEEYPGPIHDLCKKTSLNFVISQQSGKYCVNTVDKENNQIIVSFIDEGDIIDVIKTIDKNSLLNQNLKNNNHFLNLLFSN